MPPRRAAGDEQAYCSDDEEAPGRRPARWRARPPRRPVRRRRWCWRWRCRRRSRTRRRSAGRAASASRASAAAASDPAPISACAAKAVASGSLTHVAPPIVPRNPPSAHCWARRTSTDAVDTLSPARTRAMTARDCPMVLEKSQVGKPQSTGRSENRPGSTAPSVARSSSTRSRPPKAVGSPPVGDHGQERLGGRAGVRRGEVGADVATDVVLEVRERGVRLGRPGAGPVEREDGVDGVAAVEERRSGVDVVVLTRGERAGDEVRGVRGLRDGGCCGLGEPGRRRGGDALVAHLAGGGRGRRAPRGRCARRGRRTGGARGGVRRRGGGRDRLGGRGRRGRRRLGRRARRRARAGVARRLGERVDGGPGHERGRDEEGAGDAQRRETGGGWWTSVPL